MNERGCSRRNAPDPPRNLSQNESGRSVKSRIGDKVHDEASLQPHNEVGGTPSDASIQEALWQLLRCFCLELLLQLTAVEPPLVCTKQSYANAFLQGGNWKSSTKAE